MKDDDVVTTVTKFGCSYSKSTDLGIVFAMRILLSGKSFLNFVGLGTAPVLIIPALINYETFSDTRG